MRQEAARAVVWAKAWATFQSALAARRPERLAGIVQGVAASASATASCWARMRLGAADRDRGDASHGGRPGSRESPRDRHPDRDDVRGGVDERSEHARRARGAGRPWSDQIRSKRSTGITKTVAPPTSTSTG